MHRGYKIRQQSELQMESLEQPAGPTLGFEEEPAGRARGLFLPLERLERPTEVEQGPAVFQTIPRFAAEDIDERLEPDGGMFLDEHQPGLRIQRNHIGRVTGDLGHRLGEIVGRRPRRDGHEW